MKSNTSPSTLINTTGWVFLVLSGIGLLVSMGQVMFLSRWSAPPSAGLGSVSNIPGPLAGFLGYVLLRPVVLSAAIFGVCALTMILSTGLLKRWSWARRGFVWFLRVAAGWNVLSVLTLSLVFWPGRQSAAEVPDVGELKLIIFIIMGTNLVVLLGLSAVFIWLSRRLSAPEVVAQFP